jgi:hypothetical protein
VATGWRFGINVDDHLKTTDSEVLTAIRNCDRELAARAHASARRIARREHFRLVYEMNPADQASNPRSVDVVKTALDKKYGANQIRRDTYIPEAEGIEFPVYTRDGRILSSLSMSETLRGVPDFAVDCV